MAAALACGEVVSEGEGDVGEGEGDVGDGEGDLGVIVVVLSGTDAAVDVGVTEGTLIDATRAVA